MPLYDNPMIYCQLSKPMLAGIRDILPISMPHALPQVRRLLGVGNSFGVSLTCAEQTRPERLSHVFLIGKDSNEGHRVALVLGNNIFYGHVQQGTLRQAATRKTSATVFAYPVQAPGRFGVVQFDESGKAISIKEKPQQTISNYAVHGRYFYGSQVVDFTQNLKLSPRGELEITDINRG